MHEFALPDVGEGLTDAEILHWQVAEGDRVTVNQILVEIETAKASVELPSPFAGRVHAVLAAPGQSVDVGTPIVVIDTDPDAGPLPAAGVREGADGTAVGADNGTDGAAEPAGAKIGEVTADGRIATLVGYVSAGGPTARRARRTLPAAGEPAPSADQGGPAAARPAPLATPPVRRLAKDLGVDLRTVVPSGSDGVISRGDVESAVAGATLTVARPGATGDRERRVPIRGIRRATAEAMVASAFTAPHVTEFLTVDVTRLMELRDRLRRRPEFAAVKVTPLALVARAVCLAIRRTPAMNSTWDSSGEGHGDIVIKDYVHLGIAAATPRGLIVPVIRDADTLDVAGLAGAIIDLADTARAGQTSPAALAGGTFTITNVGVFGVDAGTPIIYPGQAGILAVGAIKDAPWVVDGQLAVRKVCTLAVSFDHRVVDGQEGSQFLADVGALLTDPGLALTF
ncbi:2-oxo acid dehydrogenase subunit E2 [Nakamurella flava]|uniref:Dihydrolipoamide acetyltransferase component of pyruvate dehydrogenase complex n=1 Tax=Nakamurella flava TaxID=2576308 RepID=A0A4U6Q6U7_9ACTN|nr:2-oxo acid dehydrogenase subunit E2 [Nakamurella flava]